MSTVKINLKQIKRIKRGQSKKDPNCRVRHLTEGSQTGAFGASKVLPPQTCRQAAAIVVAALSKESNVGIKTASKDQNSHVSWPGGFVALHHKIKRSHHLISRRMNSPWQVSLPYLWPRRSAARFSIARSTNSILIPHLTGRNWVVRGGGLGKLGNCACVASLIEALTPATIYRGPFWQEKPEALSIAESLLSTQSKNTFQKIH